MASFIVEAMVPGIHELIRGHNCLCFGRDPRKPRKLSTSKIEHYTVFLPHPSLKILILHDVSSVMPPFRIDVLFNSLTKCSNFFFYPYK